jgi:serine/threonine protein kinase
VGEIVGPWRLEGYAGRGAYGVVYRARRAGHPHSEPVAVKLALRSDDPRFAREVKLLTVIHHPAVPRFIDRGWWTTEDGRVFPYVVMQWVDGLSLYDWAELHNATSRQLLQVLARVAGALEATHAENCLHRDVKGDNIRVASNGSDAFLMDFGSGTWAGAPLLTDGPLPPGTRPYRSSEALRFQWEFRNAEDAHYEATPADDVYALGVAMYRVATRVHPPPGTEPEARRDDGRPVVPPRLLPQALNGRVIPELASLIEWMLADEPQRRPSAREVVRSAEASARRVGAEADVPLSGLAPIYAQPRPARVRTASEPREYDPSKWFTRLAFAGVSLFMLGQWSLPRQPVRWQPEAEEPLLAEAKAEAEEPDEGVSRDGGTSDLGDTALTARRPAQDAPDSPKRIAQKMPNEPLPDQRRAPCRRGEVELKGGCWIRWPDLLPPCGDQGYEWKGTCYLPLFKDKKTRPPTTDDRP